MASNENFNIQNQYLKYLNRVKLNVNTMHLVQKVQVKQAFYGAVGQMLILMRDDIGALDEAKAIAVFEDMLNQVGEYWNNPLNHKQ